MAFQEIKPVERAETYLDIAIKKANRKAKDMKFEAGENRFQKIKAMESAKIDVMRNVLVSKLDMLAKMFPSPDDLNEFYKELLEITVESYSLRRSLERVRWTSNKISFFFNIANKKMKAAANLDLVQNIKKEFYGRVSSIIKNLDNDLEFLKNARQFIQSFPIIKTKLKQIAIAGFPNVGKTTLLSKLSQSKPEIANYAFTTKKIMIGYLYSEKKQVAQLLDTPGTLNRFNKMNYIEKQAFLVLKMVAEKIVYIFDLTESYPLAEQEKLYERIKTFGKPMIIYLSKTDIITDKKKISDFKKRYDAISDIDELKKKIID